MVLNLIPLLNSNLSPHWVKCIKLEVEVDFPEKL